MRGRADGEVWDGFDEIENVMSRGRRDGNQPMLPEAEETKKWMN